MVKIYYADTSAVKDASVFEQLYEKINVQRRSKILRCKNKEDRYRSLVAGLLLRYVIEQEQVRYEDANIVIGENGKPYIEDVKFCFNISHSGDMVFCAVADSEIGIDVEGIGRIERICADSKRMEHFLDRIASEQEKEWFYNLPENEKKKGFLRIWTGKESYGKANGKGIALDLRKVDVLNEKDYLFREINKEYFVTVYMENISREDCQFQLIHIAKEYLK